MDSGKRKNPPATNVADNRTKRAVRTTAKTNTTTTRNSTNTKTAPNKRVVNPNTKDTKKAQPKQLEIPTEKENKTNFNIWIALIMLFLSGMVLLSCISYLKYWREDQSIAVVGEILSAQDQITYNGVGRIGAIVSDILIRQWFGIFALLTPLIPLFIAIKLFNKGRKTLYRSIRFTVITILMGSLTLGHITGTDHNQLGSGYGGQIGINVANWLQTLIGEQGTSLLILILSVSIIYYVNAGWITRVYKAIATVIYNHRENIRTHRAIEKLKLEKLSIEMQLNRAVLQKQQLKNVTPIGHKLPEIVNDSKLKENPNVLKNTANPNIETPNTETPNIENQNIEPKNTEQQNPEPKATDIPQPTPIKEDAPLPKEKTQDIFSILKLDNGQNAVVTAIDENSNPTSYLYLDAETLKTIVQPEPRPINNNDNDDDEIGTMEIVPDEQFDIPQEFPIEQEIAIEKLNTPLEIDPKPTQENITDAPAEVRPGTKTLDESNDDGPALLVEDMKDEEAVDDIAINSTQLYDPTLELRNYRKPPVELLQNHTKKVLVTDEELLENKNRILTTLNNFGIKIDTIEATIGPTVTLYEIVPSPGVRISKIKNLEDDIALSLAALGIRIIAPIPGKGTIGIEVPNKDKEIVSMYSVIKSAKFFEFKGELPVALGKTIQNETFVFDLAKMPHLLVAGATGQGKSVGLNAIITSLLYKKHPSELKFILIDPKKVELTLYSKLEKHFLAKMPDADEAIITDTQKVIYTLNSVCIEMDARYDLLKDAGMRSIKEYNTKFINRRLNPLKGHRFLPYFVVIIDEFADLIMTAGREVETPIARIAQLARAVGIHLIIATQRPTTNIITGVIKANFPARIAFRVTSQIDSRTILDSTGANQLIGRGDLLVSTGSDITRVQCAFVDTPEVELIAEHIEKQQSYPGAYELPDYQPEGDTSKPKENSGKRDPLFNEIAEYVVTNQSGSASTIQRRFSVGFNRAGRVVDQLEAAGIVGKQEGSKPRKVLISDLSSLDIYLD